MTVTAYCAHRIESFVVHIAFGPLNQGTAQEKGLFSSAPG